VVERGNAEEPVKNTGLRQVLNRTNLGDAGNIRPVAMEAGGKLIKKRTGRGRPVFKKTGSRAATTTGKRGTPVVLVEAKGLSNFRLSKKPQMTS